MRAAALGLPSPTGALVAEVVPDGPADRAGIGVGDVIVQFDGQPVKQSSDLPWLAAGADIDATVPVVALRAGQSTTFRVLMGLKPTLDGP